MIHLYTGNGKGKTTAAVGMAVRAAGSGMRVVFAQFMKGNDSGELHVLCRIPNVEIRRSPKQFGFYKTLTDAEKKELAVIHDGLLDGILETVEQGGCDMVILDEITYPVNWGLLSLEKLERLLLIAGQKADKAAAGEGGSAHGLVELVLTGRGPAVFLVECADYVTEMRAVRHPFEKGITARRGIEF